MYATPVYHMSIQATKSMVFQHQVTLIFCCWKFGIKHASDIETWLYETCVGKLKWLDIGMKTSQRVSSANSVLIMQTHNVVESAT